MNECQEWISTSEQNYGQLVEIMAKIILKPILPKKKRKNITPVSFPNENLINAVISEILGQILTDQDLIVCLIN